MATRENEGKICMNYMGFICNCSTIRLDKTEKQRDSIDKEKNDRIKYKHVLNKYTTVAELLGITVKEDNEIESPEKRTPKVCEKRKQRNVNKLNSDNESWSTTPTIDEFDITKDMDYLDQYIHDENLDQKQHSESENEDEIRIEAEHKNKIVTSGRIRTKKQNKRTPKVCEKRKRRTVNKLNSDNESWSTTPTVDEFDITKDMDYLDQYIHDEHLDQKQHSKSENKDEIRIEAEHEKKIVTSGSIRTKKQNKRKRGNKHCKKSRSSQKSNWKRWENRTH